MRFAITSERIKVFSNEYRPRETAVRHPASVCTGDLAGGKREAVLVCDGRQMDLGCDRAELVEGEMARASFLVCKGSRKDLAALAEATDPALMIDERRWSFGASGPATFRELKRRSDQITH